VALGEDSLDKLVYKTIDLLQSSLPLDVETVAIWQLENITDQKVNMEALEDKLIVSLFRSPRFKTADRSKLDIALKEQQLSLAALVDPNKRPKIGKITGVDVFVYGAIVDSSFEHPGIDDKDYYITFFVKAIDTRTGVTILAKEVQGLNEANIGDLFERVGGLPRNRSKNRFEDEGDRLVEAFSNSLSSKYKTIAIWDIESSQERKDETYTLISRLTELYLDGTLTREELRRKGRSLIEKKGLINVDDLMNKVTVSLFKSGRFDVVDRENIDLLLKEQRLSLTGVTNPEEREKVGRLLGVEVFLFGRVISTPTADSVRLSWRGIDVSTGEIVWADDSVVGQDSFVRIPRKPNVVSIEGKPKRQFTPIPERKVQASGCWTPIRYDSDEYEEIRSQNEEIGRYNAEIDRLLAAENQRIDNYNKLVDKANRLLVTTHGFGLGTDQF
jgi:curli biogenesis system outer membrane secretion channel CsgG